MPDSANKILSGQTERIATINPSKGISLFAKFALLVLFLLLVFTSLTVSRKAQLSDPSWPLVTSELFAGEWVGELKYEYGRRIIQAVSGIITIGLVIAVFAAEKRRWIRKMTGAVFVFMVAEFITAGLVVKTIGNPYAAMVHGVLLQLYFVLMVVLTYGLSTAWFRDAETPIIVNPHNNGFLKFLRITAVVVFLQIVFGNSVRYGLDQFLAFLLIHITLALSVIAVIIWYAMRTMLEYKDVNFLTKSAKLMLAVIGVQLLLGIFAIFSNRARTEPDVTPYYLAAISLFHMFAAVYLLSNVVITTIRAERLLKRNDDISGVTGSQRVKEVVA